MKTFYSELHRAHVPTEEFEAGRMTPAVEVPERVEAVRRRIVSRGLGPILHPSDFGSSPALRVHNPAFVAFLQTAYARWTEMHPGVDAIPSVFSSQISALRDSTAGSGENVMAHLGHYCFDTGTPLTRGSWSAATAAANTALSAARAICDGETTAFALTRPPGHHASATQFGGYCYLNNVAIAAQFLVDNGARCAILDVDYHHGNGTQDIFYARNDVLFVSLHADPTFAYPVYWGSAVETGQGSGEGFNLNLPLPAATQWQDYRVALDTAIARIHAFFPDVLLVSLGLDTFALDPICRFQLQIPDYPRLGEAIAQLRKPTVFVFEGGYDLAHLAENTVNVLEGYLAA
jgi:acetoin utilization deacetylase AcuC-like enzyme